MKTKELVTENGPVKYFSCGHGPPILMLHGFLGRPQDFRWMLPTLAEQHHIYLPELPGMVSTDLANHPPLDQQGMASFVTAFLNAIQVQSCHIVAHSMGAGVAVSFAARAPERVQSLTLISPVSHRAHKALRYFSPKFGYALLRSPMAFLARPLTRYGLRQMGFSDKVSDAAIFNSLWFNSLFEFAVHKESLCRLEMPVLLSYTENDPQIELQIFEELGTLLQAANILRFADGGHNPQKHHADALTAAIIQLMMDCR